MIVSAPDPVWIASSITHGEGGSVSDPCWGWLGSGAETRFVIVTYIWTSLVE